MTGGDLRVLRARYLFDLAAVCHCPPPVVDKLRVTDFARLTAGLDHVRATAPKPPGVT